MTLLRLTLLGGFAVEADGGRSCALPARKARALLAYLALPAGRAHSREKLTALLWGETPDDLARQAFRQTLSRLRRALGDPAAAIVEVSDALALDPARVWVDTADFEATAALNTPAALERAAGLYRGDLLDGFHLDEPPFEEWRTVERERLRETALEVLAKLLRHQMQTDALEPAVQTALRALALDPLQEVIHRVLMRLYVKQGRRAAALHQYQECVQSLQSELGAEPEQVTRHLYREILRGGGHSDAPAVPSGVAYRPRPQRVGRGAAGILVAREAELAALERALDATLEAGASAVLISGEAGIGKTRLVEALAELAAARGVRMVLGRCYETEQPLPFRPWVDALRGDRVALDPAQVAGLNAGARAQLPRLFSELPPAIPDNGIVVDDHGGLFEAVRELLAAQAAQGPMIVVLEDLHWADPMSLRLLAFLGRRMGPLPVLFVATARLEDTESPILERAMVELREAGGLGEVPVGPLNFEQSLSLARTHDRGGDLRVLEGAAAALWRLSEGNPFVIVETVRMLREAPGRAASGELPPNVREALRHRLGRLSEPARTAAITAAVIGRATPFRLLPAASGLSEPAAAAAVEELIRRRILDASGELLDFAHDRIRRVVYDLVPPHRRAMLHEAVAVALESGITADGEDSVDEIGRHFVRAGRGDRAYPYLLRFASLAQARYDLEAAAAALRRAEGALDHLPAGERARARLELGLREGEVLAVTGRQRECLELLLRLEPLRDQIGDSMLSARYCFGLAIAQFFLGNYTGACEAATRGLQEADRTGDDERIGAALFTLGLACIGLGDFRSSAAYATRAAAVFDRAHLRRWQAQACWLLAQSQVMRGDLTEALGNAARSAAFAEAAGDTPFRSITESVVAWVHAARGEGQQAVEHASQAVALSKVPMALGIAMRMLGYAHLEAGDAVAAIGILERLVKLSPARHPYVHALACLAEAYRMVGDCERASGTAREAIALAQAAANPFNLGLAERALARATADPACARVALDRALAAFMASEASVEVAVTRLDLARSCAHAGDRPGAGHQLAAAVEAFEAAGAPERVRQARELSRSLRIGLAEEAAS